MSEEQLKELGYRLTGLKIKTNKTEVTCLKWDGSLININLRQIRHIQDELFSRGFSSAYLSLQVLLHEVAHFKQYLKYGDRFQSWYLANYEKAEKIADRYALMYYKRFVENAIYT